MTTELPDNAIDLGLVTESDVVTTDFGEVAWQPKGGNYRLVAIPEPDTAPQPLAERMAAEFYGDNWDGQDLHDMRALVDECNLISADDGYVERGSWDELMGELREVEAKAARLETSLAAANAGYTAQIEDLAKLVKLQALDELLVEECLRGFISASRAAAAAERICERFGVVKPNPTWVDAHAEAGTVTVYDPDAPAITHVAQGNIHLTEAQR